MYFNNLEHTKRLFNKIIDVNSFQCYSHCKVTTVYKMYRDVYRCIKNDVLKKAFIEPKM